VWVVDGLHWSNALRSGYCRAEFDAGCAKGRLVLRRIALGNQLVDELAAVCVLDNLAACRSRRMSPPFG
jgi:hypothetical protein